MALIADFVSGQSNVTYTRMRELLLESGGGLQEGVISGTDLKVAQRGAGAAQNVDIPAGAAWVTVDTGTRNGISHAFNDAVANVTVAAADGTNPRIDQACLQYNDTAIPAGTGGNIPTFRILTGTATAGATLDNRTGAAALPNDCLRLADILVPAASTSVVTANIRDRRPWARGFFRSVIGDNAADITNASGVMAQIGQSAFRLECSGTTMRIGVQGQAFNTIAGSGCLFALMVDGASIGIEVQRVTSLTASESDAFGMNVLYTPTAGSHTFGLGIAAETSGTATLRNSGNVVFTVCYEEIVRQNASNT